MFDFSEDCPMHQPIDHEELSIRLDRGLRISFEQMWDLIASLPVFPPWSWS